MKQLIGLDKGSYIFNPLTRQITIQGCGNLKLEQILLITNVTTNTMLYNFADASIGASILNNVLTLDYDTTSMNASDNLQIFAELPDEQLSILGVLKQGLKFLESLATVDTSKRQRVNVETGNLGTISTVSTVSTITNVPTIGGVEARLLQANAEKTAYYTGIRSQIIIN